MPKRFFFAIFSTNILFAVNPQIESTSMQKSYEDFTSYAKKISLISSIQGLVSWDQETFMPKGAIEGKSKQLELLADMVHKESTSDHYKSMLSELIDFDTGKVLLLDATAEQKANLREWRRDLIHEIKLPDEFVQKFAATACKALESWKKAREKSSFKIFEADLEKIVSLNKQKAKYLGYKKHPYDALLDTYEPNLTTEKLDQLFSSLKPKLIALLKEIKQKSPIDNSFLFKKYPSLEQLNLSYKIMDSMTIDKNYCGLYQSVHPFTSGIYAPQDVRITTKIIENNLSPNIFGVLHEGGHALYELGLSEEHIGTPLGQAVSMAFHESQSRLWETLIGHGKAYWQFFYKTLQTSFPKQLQNIDLETFYRGINKVEPSLIRIESDEVSYCLHIIIRYEIEKALLDNTLQVADIPKAWNEKMQDYLGITPPSDSLGCLQDIHWSMGALGYFPSYALGNMYAAQIFAAFQKENPSWEEKIISGDLHGLRDWLKMKIHSKGRFYVPDDLIKEVTGKELTSDAYVLYLKQKYTDIYKL